MKRPSSVDTDILDYGLDAYFFCPSNFSIPSGKNEHDDCSKQKRRLFLLPQLQLKCARDMPGQLLQAAVFLMPATGLWPGIVVKYVQGKAEILIQFKEES